MLPVLSGLLLGASYLPGPLLALNLSCFLPILSHLETRPAATGYARLKAGFGFGLVTHLIAMHWMYALLDYSWLASLLYVGTVLVLAMRIALSVVLLGWLRRRTGLSWALLLPLTWLPFEWVQTWGDTRWTADHLAYSVAGNPFLVQFADLVGPYGVSAVLLVMNGLLFEAIFRRGQADGRRALVALSLVSVAVLAYDTWAWNRPNPEEGSLTVAIVQPNVPLAVKHDAERDAEQWESLAELTREAVQQGAELVIWPESSRPLPIHHWLGRPATYRMTDVQSLARSLGVPIIVGVEYFRIRDSEDFDRYNAAVGVDASGHMLQNWGAKVYLVPFTEALPFEGLLGPLLKHRGGEWRWVTGGFSVGPDAPVLEVAGARVGVLVCYEQLFPDLSRRLRAAGATLQVVITNDSWFGRSFLQRYLADALRLRAIENRTAYVRVANTGISGFVDRWGRYETRTPLFERTVETREVRLSTAPTVYGRIGDVVAWLAIAGLGVAVVLGRR